ncbi:chorismate mutase [Clostridium pasteurianum DSM 525 = ATCC 6013]|uniref:Chorismate mutase n=1 Tax=Clostridium pasteurianum DSM 525 = ATCC 6013 TaxID=1262449 RepID=A0A0H3J7G6_CLOPA|nr:chorismate mutase [Clostridium pasteurianum]AJA46935.1 chorismate mutase [Clostridium pasteurianum DSM 525 = ATCC 6013]AJA50923.1 chorismate mutase [Clostridium pasteurianum DSM 525 = ATCC 6013]AOZ74317.1 chorismate mutase [Clostridium pasteurianum DSM 525 = ATCC 6013]AOZ78115.1 chorismate mutase [Clostridium pasteurianum]ELP58184.1 chorismate mutase [Clostridium pasteurianum DSM 525 = ATCC 6013]
MNNCKNLNEVRENIDRIDNEIVKLIAERSYYVKQAASFKKDSQDVEAPKRVEMIIEKVCKLAEDNNLNPHIIEIIYRNMINSFITLELETHSKTK